MATKKITKAGTYDISKAKDNTTFVIKSNVANSVTLNFQPTNWNYNFQKSGNDLILYWESNGKLLTSTIKDYYKYYYYNSNLVKLNNSSVNPSWVEWNMSVTTNANGYVQYKYNGGYYNFYFNKKGSNYYQMVVNPGTETYEAINDKAGNDTYDIWNKNAYDSMYIRDYEGKDKYIVNDYSKAEIYDFKGNDSYELLKDTTSEINDFAGNDKYRLVDYYSSYIYEHKGNDVYNSFNGSNLTIEDYAGKDVYNINSNYYSAYIYDAAGNDKYNFSSPYYAIYVDDSKGNDTYNAVGGYYGDAAISITDHAGNDKYTMKAIGDDIRISDKAGNDKYSLSEIYDEIDINDYKGKDNYNIKNSDEVKIYDYEGADTYNINGNKSNFHIEDGESSSSKKGGNDKYNLSNFQSYNGNTVYDYYGNEKYNISYGIYLYLQDNHGKDSYTANNMNYLHIQDGGTESDTYKISDSTHLYISEYYGNDTYTLNNLFNYDGYTNNIYDGSGADKYNVSKSNIYINDESSSNDKYTVKTDGAVEIYDEGGKDSLILSANKKNLVFMTNYAKVGESTYKDTAASLIIYDVTNGGYVKIDHFYSSNDSGSYTGYDDGRIETIKAGKKAITGPDAAYFTASIKSNIATWLNSESDYNSVVDVLQKGSEEDIAAMVYAFQGGEFL